jgi:hypothetical protein
LGCQAQALGEDLPKELDAVLVSGVLGHGGLVSCDTATHEGRFRSNMKTGHRGKLSALCGAEV